MTAAERARSAASTATSAAPAIPARTASRSRCSRRRRRDLRRALLAEAEREADRPRRARLAAPGSRPLPLRPRHRRDDAARSRPASPGRSRSGGAARAASPAPSASSDELARRPARKRVGIKPEGRAPAREGTEICSRRRASAIGVVTSGGFGPSVNGPVAMGYVETGFAEPGTPVNADGARQGARLRAVVAAAVRAASLRPQDLTREETSWPSNASPRTTNGYASTATSRTVGITDHAQEQLGDVVFVELPEVGTQGREGRRGGRRGRERQGGERRLRAGVRRGGRGQWRRSPDAAPRQRGRGGQGLVLQDQDRRHRANSTS